MSTFWTLMETLTRGGTERVITIHHQPEEQQGHGKNVELPNLYNASAKRSFRGVPSSALAKPLGLR